MLDEQGHRTQQAQMLLPPADRLFLARVANAYLLNEEDRAFIYVLMMQYRYQQIRKGENLDQFRFTFSQQYALLVEMGVPLPTLKAYQRRFITFIDDGPATIVEMASQLERGRPGHAGRYLATGLAAAGPVDLEFDYAPAARLGK